jgi:hypothetical protein
MTITTTRNSPGTKEVVGEEEEEEEKKKKGKPPMTDGTRNITVGTGVGGCGCVYICIRERRVREPSLAEFGVGVWSRNARSTLVGVS